MKKDIAVLAGVSRPTVDLSLARYAADGAPGLLATKPGGPREQVPADVRSRVLALTRTTPPERTGLSHWSTRTMADYITRTAGTPVSHHWVANLCRRLETGGGRPLSTGNAPVRPVTTCPRRVGPERLAGP